LYKQNRGAEDERRGLNEAFLNDINADNLDITRAFWKSLGLSDTCPVSAQCSA
jgi:hypothetical protein